MRKVALILLLFLCFSVHADAAHIENDTFSQQLMDAVGTQERSLMNVLGIETGNYEEILSISYEKVLELILQLVRGEISAPLTTALRIIAVMFILFIISAACGNTNSYSQLSEVVGILLISFLVLVPTAECVTQVLSAVNTVNGFTKVLVPVFAGIVTFSGNPAMAVCFQTACLGVATAFSSWLTNAIAPVCGLCASFAVCGSVNPDMQTQQAASFVKKGFTYILAFSTALFSAVLSVKSVLSAGADSVSMKGLKFLVGSAVPVVGGALADSMNSVLAGIHLIKDSVAVFAVILLFLTILPGLVQIILWRISLIALASVSSLIGLKRIGCLFESLDGIFANLSAVLVYVAFLHIIALSLVVLISRR